MKLSDMDITHLAPYARDALCTLLDKAISIRQIAPAEYRGKYRNVSNHIDAAISSLDKAIEQLEN